MKSTRAQLDIITAYQELGSYRAAAKLCGTTDKTVKRIIERQQLGELAYRIAPRPVRNTDAVRDLIHQRVSATDGRISAKRLLPRARAAGYAGSARNFRRAVAAIKTQRCGEPHFMTAGGREAITPPEPRLVSTDNGGDHSGGALTRYVVTPGTRMASGQ